MAGRNSPKSMSGDYGNGDEQFALNVVSSIRGRIADMNMTDNEDLCKDALSSGGVNVLINRDGPKAAKKHERKNSTELFQKPLTPLQSQNQALRFGYGATGVTNTRSSWNFFRSSTADIRELESRRDYEDVVDPEILNAPICDVCIVQSKTLPPPGFYRLHKTPTNKKADLNLASSGNPLYLCIKKDLSGALYPITNFIVVFPDRNEYTPPGYAVVNRGKTACNLNSGTTSERIFLCYRKDAVGNPLTDIQVILPTKGEVPPPAFNLIEKSISGIPANLNTGTGGTDVYFCYRQSMSRLNCLLTEPTPAEEDTRARLRSIRRNSMRSFDDADRTAVVEGLPHHQQSQSFSIGTSARPGSGSIQPIAINTLAGNNGTHSAFRFRSVSTGGNATPLNRKTSAIMEVGAAAHAQSQGAGVRAHTTDDAATNHGALPSSVIFNIPQALPPGAARGAHSPVNVTRSSIPKHPRFVETTGADMPHSVSFSDHLPDTPSSVVHPFEQDEFNASPQNSARERTYPSHTSLDTLEEGSLSNSNRDRANSTSTTQTGLVNEADGGRQSHNSHLSQHSQSLSQDNHSVDNHSQVIEADCADSDMPMHTDSSNLKRRQTYAEFEHPLEGEDFEDDADEEEYAGEMAYLLAQMQQNKRLEVVDSYGTCPPLVRRKALLAILAALYIRQGTVSSAALAGLSDLLKDSNFFAMDLHRLPAPGTTTMIDLTVEAVCDRFELSADGERDSLLRFLGLLTPYCGSKLSLYSLQRIFSACMFLCCHYAITKPELLEASLGSFSLDQDNYDDYDGKDNGVPSFKLFSQLLTDTFRKAEEENVADHLPPVGSYDNDDLSSVASSTLSTTHRAGLALHTQSYLDVKEIVDDFVAGVLDNIEVARLSEVAFHTVSKQSYSTISPPFWKELTALSTTLFEGQGYRSAFVLLGAICKQAWHTVRTKSSGEPVSRDVGVKLVAFGALEQFCMMAGENIRASRIFGYQIRRMVIPCLLYNVSYAFMDHRIFSKMLKLISAIWKHWRRHVRIEFAIICEQFIFKVMQATVVQVRPIFKMIMIQEVTKWFEQPHMLLEMFVNYDMDRKFVSHWSTFSYLVRTFCAIGRRVLYSSAAATPAEAHEGGGIENAVTIRDVHMQALEEVARMAKTLMDASGHAYLILQDSGFRNKSVTRDGGWEDDDCKSPGAPDAPEAGTGRYSPNAEMLRTTSAHSDETTEGTPVPNSVSSLNTVATTATGMTTATGVTGVAGASQRRRLGSIRQRRELHQESEALIKKAVEIYTAKNDLKKAVNFLIKSEFLANTPQEIANFLRVYKNSFDPAAIGDFLGEGGKNPAEEEYWTNIRFRYTRAVSFVEMDIEPALRLYLTGCGFRMPGEAQKINRFVEVFVKAFWQDNSGTANCPFKKEDTVHLLAYAIIILNTDLNNVNLDKKGKKRQRMSKEDFFKQLRGCDDGNDIDKEYLTRIYDNIAAQAIELKVTSPDAKISDDTCFVSNPQYYSAAGVSPEVRAVEEKKFVHEMCSSLRDSEDLLRSLSTSSFLFVDTKISLDLVSFMYESVWFHFHTIAEALLNAATSDMFVKITALDILSHALTCAIFLDLKVERMTLAGLLNTFLNKCESLPHVSHVKRSPKIPDNSWYEDVENAYPSTALETISKLHHLFVYIKDMLQESENYENTRQVADKLDKKVRIMEMNSFFVRQGDLAKLSKTKRSTMYRFFLFSDELIYAHLSRGVYVVHEELPLLEMSVEDNPNDPSMCSFFIEHPTKSFQVIAESPSARQYWIRDIGQTIASCKKRFEVSRMSSDVRRMSIFTRIDSQKAVQQQEADAVKRAAERAASNQANSPGGGMKNSRDEGDAFSPTMSPLTGTSTHPRYSASSQSVPFVGGVDTPASVDSQSPCSLAGAYLSERDGTKSSRAQDALSAVSDGDQTPVSPTTSTSRHQLSALFDSIEQDDEFSKE